MTDGYDTCSGPSLSRFLASWVKPLLLDCEPNLVCVLHGYLWNTAERYTTNLNTLSTEGKVAIRSLLDIINLCLFAPTYQGNAWHHTYYQLRLGSQRSQRPS